MSRGKRVTTETIINTLREVEINHGQGHTIVQCCREYGIIEQTHYCWRKQYGGMQLNQVYPVSESWTK